MRIPRYFVSVIFVFAMFVSAFVSGSKVFIFPEFLTLLMGTLCTDRIPWKTDGVHTVILMTIAAAVGTVIVRFAPFAMYFQALIGLAVVALLMILLDCSLMPCIAACLFPIYFKENSMIFPLIVAAGSAIAVMLRGFFVNRDMLEADVKFRYLPDFEEELKLWGVIIAAFAILSALPFLSGYIFFLAPPLAVTFVEGCHKRLSGKRIKIWFVITVAAVIGVLIGYVGTDMLGLPGFITATAATALTILEMRLMNMMFPPAGAVVLLAFLIEGNTFLYPPMISVGAAVVLFVSAYINNRMVE